MVCWESFLTTTPPSETALDLRRRRHRRRRLVLFIGGGLLLTLLVATVASSWVWGRMLQPTCDEIARPDLSLQEMVDVKLKVDESERQDSAAIRLSGREASFLLRDVLHLPMHLDVGDGTAHLTAAVPWRDACYNIEYRGGVELANGIAHLEPERFRIGDLDLTSWSRGPTPVARLEWLSPAVAEAFGHLEGVRVEGDVVVVEVDDVRALR